MSIASITLRTRCLAISAGLLLITGGLRAQLVVLPQPSVTDLARAISGPGVSISNAAILCHQDGFGEFSYTGSQLGLQEGVILTTGLRDNAIGPNNNSSQAFNASRPGSSILNIVTGRTTFDQCKLEFDIIPAGDSLQFNFSFGSEEYNEWVGSQFNDVFGFFISGPGITGDPGIGADHNIALIPGSGQAVTINAVNNGSNSQYYHDNTGGSEIQYDGFTQNLKAVTSVTPCQSYHLKLIIADATDNDYDSGVFIEKVKSNPVTMAGFTNSGGPDLIEGCNNGYVRFSRAGALTQPLTLQYFLQGTGTNGVDYQAIGNTNPNVVKTITIPANQNSVDRPITTIINPEAEPAETMVFILGNPNCPAMALDTVIMTILDTLAGNLNPTPPGICLGGSLQFQATGGTAYSWSPATGLSATNIPNPTATPTTTTTYQIIITDAIGCSRTIRRSVRVSNMSLSGTVVNPLCNGGNNGAINLMVTGGLAPFSYAWTGPNGFTASSEDLSNRPAGVYNVTVTDAVCSRSQSFTIGQPNVIGVSLIPSILAFGQNIACNGANTGWIDATLTGGTAPYTVAWTGPSGFTSSNVDLANLIAGTYNVSVTDNNGCVAAGSRVMTQAAAFSASISSFANVACFGANNGTATVAGSGGVPPYSYSWNTTPVKTTATASNLPPGTFTVTVTDAYGCTTTAQRTITQPASTLSSSLVAHTNINCRGAATGSATVSASGGTSPYSFSWNTSPAQNSATVTGRTAGTWTCTITDARGCTTTRVVTITEPATGISTSIASQTNVICRGANTGSATVSASGGNGPYTFVWNTAPTQNSAAATNLPAGTWVCTVTDQSGCSTTRSITITQPSAGLNGFITTLTNIQCFGSSTGAATASASGGTSPYTYSWNTSPVTNSASISNKPAGTYTCTIIDAGGCVTTANAVITQPTQLVGTILAQQNIGCHGDNTGSATVGASGGAGGYSFVWNTAPPVTTSSVNNVPFGAYSATVTDANGCITTAQVVIAEPPSPVTTTANVTPATCGGPNTGAVDATITGGTAPYTYQWSSANGFTSTAQDITNLAAGIYTLLVTDNNNCTATSTWNVNQPGLFTITSVKSNYQGFNVACRNGSNGAIDMTVSGATPPYTYTWTGPNGFTATSEDISGVPAGNYVFTVSDAGGCSNAVALSLNQPSAVSTTLSSATNGNGYNITCFGGSNGSVTSAPSGGIGPYTYAWSGPGGFTSSGQSIGGRPTGTYTLITTDNNGCPNTSSITLTQPNALAATASVVRNVLCFGGSTGRATVSGAGGVAPYNYSWNTSPVQTSATANNLGIGMRTVTVADANGCTTSASVTITQPAGPIDGSISDVVHVLCRNQNTGSATITASGGTTPYTYSWNSSPSQTNATAVNLSAGMRTCTITDANGCTVSRSVTINQPSQSLSANSNVQVQDVSCFGANDGSITLNPSGGTPPYFFEWNTSPIQTTATASNLGPGSWTCLITDGNGCTRTKTVAVDEPNAALSVSIGAQTNVLCAGGSNGSATVSVSGGTGPFTYSWNTTPVQSGATASGLSAGSYVCTVSDVEGCPATVNISITQPSSFIATLGAQTNVTCFGMNDGTASISVSGGTPPYFFTWSSGTNATTASVSGLALGNHTCHVRDGNNCTVTVPVSITSPSAALFTSASVQTASCQGAGSGAVNITVTGGTVPYTYSWTGTGGFTATTEDIINLQAGTYTVLVTDNNGCTQSTAWTVTDPGTFTVNADLSIAANGFSLLCPGSTNGWISTEVRGGQAPYTYSWTGPNGYTANADDISGLGAGTYVFTATGALGCSTSRTYEITAPPAFVSTLVGADAGNGFNISCTGGSNGSINGAVTGGNAPLTYAWSGPGGFTANTPNINGRIVGTYNLNVTDVYGCTFSTSVTLTQPPALSASASVISNVLCRGNATGTAMASATGGVASYNYSWNTTPVQNGPAASALPAGNWIVTVTDGNGCTTTANVTITQPATALAASLSTSTNVSCFGATNGSASVAASGGVGAYAYQWNTTPVQSTAIASNLAPGTYSCLVTDVNGCQRTVPVTITEPAAALAIGITAQINVLCFGSNSGSATVSASNGTAPYTHVWNTTPIQNGATAINLLASDHTCTVMDVHGCTAQVTVTITQPAEPLALSIASQTNVLCFSNATGSATMEADGGAAPYTYSWNTVPEQNGSAVTNLAAGNYTCTVIDDNGCSRSSQVTITQPSAALAGSITTRTHVLCFGNNTGSATASSIGGSGPYNYAWNTTPPQSNATATALTEGTYICTITDANGCTTTVNATITQPAAGLATSITAQTSVNCFGNATGSATVSAASGTGPYNYSWNTTPPQTTANATGLAEGVYTCLVTDANGCTAPQQVTITGPSAGLVASISAQTDVLCRGNATGSATAVGANGTSPYTYSWNTSPVQSTATIGNLIAGSYTCTATDNNGCTTNTTVTITQPAAALGVVTDIVPAACQGANNGEVEATVTGGTGAYTFAWSGPSGFAAATEDIAGVEAGVYGLLVTDGNGCTNSTSWNVNQPGLFTVSRTLTTFIGGGHVSCSSASDGAIDMTVSGATPPYTYSWTGPDGYTSNDIDINGITAGDYVFSVVDDNGCATSESITLIAPQSVSVVMSSALVGTGYNVSCNGGNNGSIDATVQGGVAPLSYVWSGPLAFNSNSEDVNALDAGMYTLTATDANGCAAVENITLNEPTALVANTSVAQAVSCHGGSNGSSTATVSGGVAPYGFTWDSAPAQSTAQLSGVPADDYTCTITDAHGCTTTTSLTMNEPAAALAGSITTQTGALCFGNANGSATVAVTEGTAPYTFNWNTIPEQTTATASGLVAGDHSCTVTDDNGCSTTVVVTIAQPAATLTATIASQLNVRCFGGSNGTASANSSGGTGAYTYSWNTTPVQTGATATGLIAGSYQVTSTDANGCSANANVTIIQPAQALGVGLTNITHQSCFGSLDGQATVQAAGGTAPYTYSWNTTPVQTGATVVGRAAGTYTVTVRDNLNCTTTLPVTINGPSAALALIVTSQTNLLCHGEPDGAATVNATGGTAPYSYEWNTNPQTFGASINDQPAGTYTALVSDNNGCTTSINVPITQPVSEMDAFVDQNAGVSCHGGNDAYVTIDLSGGSGSYTVIWHTQPQQFGTSATNLSAGLYFVEIIDNNGCPISKFLPVTVSEPSADLQVSAVPSVYGGGFNTHCVASNDGSINATATGGTTPYNYVWTLASGGNLISEDLAALSPGNYSVVVTDARACSATTNATIQAPTALNAMATIQTAACQGASDGWLTSNVSGGVGPYELLWTGPGGFTATTPDIFNLIAGVYTLSIVDANGCTNSLPFDVNEPGLFTVNADLSSFIGGANVSCSSSSDGSIDITASGGTGNLSYAWVGSNGFTSNSADVSGLVTGTYELTITDENGCSKFISYTINAPAPLGVGLTAQLFEGDNVSCASGNNGSINATPAGGTFPYTFNWSGPNGFSASTEDISALTAGTYTIQVTDANGCSTTAAITLIEPAPVAASATAVEFGNGSNISCNGAANGSIDLTVVGGHGPYSVNWSGPNGFVATTQDVNGLAPGTYTANITDVNGCSTSTSITLIEPDPLVLNADLSTSFGGTEIACNGVATGSIDLTVSGGAGNNSYQWVGPNAFVALTEDITGLVAGIYDLRVLDQNGCIARGSYVITQPDPINATVVISSALCQGSDDGAIDMTVTGGVAPYTHQWVGGFGSFSSVDEDINDVFAGVYIVNITDANGCTHEHYFDVTEPGEFVITATLAEHNGGYNVSCAGSADGAIDVTAQGGTPDYTYIWNGPSNYASSQEDITDLAAGLYSLILVDQNGCNTLAQYNLTEPTAVGVGLLPGAFAGGANTSCDGTPDGSIDAFVAGGESPYALEWSGPNGFTSIAEDITGLEAGIYTLNVIDAIGCDNSGTITLVGPTPVETTVTATAQNGGTSLSCNGGNNGSIDLTIAGGAAPYLVAWSGPNGYGSNNVDLNDLAAGTYTAVVTDANGCTGTSTITLTAPSPVVVQLTASEFTGGFNIPCRNISIATIDATVSGGLPGYTLLWSGPNGFSSTSSNLVAIPAGDYNLVATDANGCTGYASISITQPDEFDVLAQPSATATGYEVSCFGNDGAIALDVAGGTAPYQFSWFSTNGFASQDEDISNLEAGEYNLTILDDNGCLYQDTIILRRPDPITASMTISGNLCAGSDDGTIDLEAAGGAVLLYYDWSGPNGFTATSEDIGPLSAGDYTVVITDIGNCSATLIGTIEAVFPIAMTSHVSEYGGVNIACVGDSAGVIEVGITGGSQPLTVEWTGPNGFTSSARNLSGLLAGTYDLHVVDDNGCIKDTTFVLTEPSTPIAGDLLAELYPSGTNISCFGSSDGSVDLTVTGGTAPYSFNWRSADSTNYSTEDISAVAAGLYDLVITDANFCNLTLSIVLTEPDSALSAAYTVSQYGGGYGTSCSDNTDGSIGITVIGGNGGTTIEWNGPNGFSSGTDSLSGLEAGTYNVLLTDMNGCTSTQVVEVTAPESLAPVLTPAVFAGGGNTSCAGVNDGSITATITGGVADYTLAWSGPNGFASTSADIIGLEPGTYCLSVNDANGCATQQCAVIVAATAMMASTTTTNASCGSTTGTVELTVNGGGAPYTYLWQNGTITEDLSGVSVGDYTVTITDANGCIIVETATITGAPGMQADASVNNVLCNGDNGGSIDVSVLQGTAPYQYAWSNGELTEDLNGLFAGTYSISVSDAAGCAWTNTYTVNENSALVVDEDVTVHSNGYNVSALGRQDGRVELNVSGGAAPYTYVWSNGATTSTATDLAAGTYTVLITDANGCSVELEFELDEPTDLVMPTGYSPNGDGSNDLFVVRGIEGYMNNQFTVFNRWGNIVYEALNYKNEWAGENSQGDYLPNGTYFVILTVNNGARTLQGFVDLRR